MKTRNQEDRQRFLSAPEILLPDAEDDPHYLDLLRAYGTVCADFLHIDESIDAPTINRLTGGNRRLLRILVKMAYGAARRRSDLDGSRTRVTMSDLRSTYLSSGFSDHRSDIEICRNQLLTNKMIREDLWPPFDLPPEKLAVQARLARQAHQSLVSHAVLQSSLKPAEVEAVKSLHNRLGMDSPMPGLRHTAERRKPRPPLTVASLLDGD